MARDPRQVKKQDKKQTEREKQALDLNKLKTESSRLQDEAKRLKKSIITLTRKRDELSGTIRRLEGENYGVHQQIVKLRKPIAVLEKQLKKK